MLIEYAPLHVHSDASLDGAGTVQSLVQAAKKLGLGNLALTDHGTLGNAVSFWSACDEAGIKPILGMEAYFLWKGKRHHLTILSLNETGFNNLIALDSESHADHFNGGYPLVDLNLLEKHHKNLFVLSGCISSALYEGSVADGAVFAGEMQSVMGKNFGMEVMFAGTHDTWTRPLEISKQLNIPFFVTNDTHYPCQHQFPAHQCITSARRGFTYDSRELWLKSSHQIINAGTPYVGAALVQRGLNNTLKLADCVVPFDMKTPPNLPSIPHAEEDLKKLVTEALRIDVKVKGQQELRVKRASYEFNFLRTKKFLDYIYILRDIIQWAHGSGIRVGPGRGSGSGSYVLYLLGITTVDPIEYDLVFERFLNPARIDYPDVDVDFEADRRHEVLNYAKSRWGAIPIATYSSYSHKSAIHDIARTLHIPKDLEIKAADSVRDSEAFENFINEKPDALVVYETMLGQIRHRGKHAAGVIIPNRPVPIERSGDELVAAWAEGMNTKELSKVGIVKFDLLGLTALSQLKRMAYLSGATFPGKYDDPNVFELFCDGDVAGIFQWSGSDGIRELTVRIAPNNFYDLTTCNALYRPGALHAGTADDYPEYMRHPRKLHPLIDKHLEKTYGVICYQEQVMAIIATVMDGDLAQADLARRLISKADVGNPAWEEDMEELYRNFLEHGQRQGIDKFTLEKLWGELYTHSGYSYNLAHATTYTMISYEMAWYKVYHRSAFIVSVLQYDKDNAQTYILDAIRHGLVVNTPKINYSTSNYELVGKDIVLPLSDVAYLGEKAMNAIIEERNSKGPFTSYADFDARITKRQCNNRARGMLERINAFSDLSGDPADAIKDYHLLPIKTHYDTQLEILSYIIPSKKFIENMERMLRKPTKPGYTNFAGFISKVTNKKSAHGEYTVYTLSPEGQFWCRPSRPELTVGSFVSGTKSGFGHSTNVRKVSVHK